MKLYCYLLLVQTALFSQTVIHHAMGTTVIETTPKKIVTLFNGATDTAIALGIKPIAAVESWVEKPMYAYLKPSLDQVEYVGLETQPNIEKIALLKPDVIFAAKFRNEKIYKLLSAIAPTIMVEDLNDFKTTLKLMSQALHQEQKAKELLQDWDNRIYYLHNMLQKFYQNEWPQEVSIINIRSNYFRSFFDKSFAGYILNELGFKIKNSEEYLNTVYIKLTSKESLPVVDASTFFILKQSKNAMVTQHYETLQRNPLWQHLKAVQNQRVYDVDTIAWSFSAGLIGANMVLDEIEVLFDSQMSTHE